jgi:DNA-directed RNA polymerase specialized sigma24 family protein
VARLKERDNDFEAFVILMRPKLIRAFAGCRGVSGAADAAAEAIAYAFEHWERVSSMDNPGGYLYRVGQSRTRPALLPDLPHPAEVGEPEVEPDLVPALLALPETQRTAVWLVHACGWTYDEVAAAIGTSTSMVGNHVSRAMQRLRRRLEVDLDA